MRKKSSGLLLPQAIKKVLSCSSISDNTIIPRYNQNMMYYRIHTADIAWITQQPRGLFTAIGKLVDAKTLTEEETAEYWKNREYFEKVLPVPPFYEQGNPDHATTWFKDTPQGNDIYRQMNFYRKMAKKYGLKLYMSKCTEVPGEIIYEDDFQIAIKNLRTDVEITVTELELSDC